MKFEPMCRSQARPETEDGPFGIYLHIPFCKSRCDYCGFVSSCDFSRVEPYFTALRAEIAAWPEKTETKNGTSATVPGTSETVLEKPGFDTLFVGGGTPSAVEPQKIARTLEVLRGTFRECAGAELTIECNPDSLTPENLKRYLDLGFNRFSLGVQSFSDKLLKNIGRRHDRAGALKAVELVRNSCENVSVDLMLGLPEQTAAEVSEDLKIVRGLGIPHVSAYGLKVEEGTRLAARGYQPDEDLSADLYGLVLDRLGEFGLIRYEVSNFAKIGFESRHNLKYWRRQDYLGFGAAAHSCVGNRRFANADSVSDYLERASLSARPGSPDGFALSSFAAESETLSAAEVEYETIILALRTEEGLNRRAFEKKFHCRFAEKYASAIRKCGDFLIVSPDFVRVSREGFYLLNALLVNF